MKDTEKAKGNLYSASNLPSLCGCVRVLLLGVVSRCLVC